MHGRLVLSQKQTQTALSNLGLYCLQYSPPKYISRRESRQQLSLIAGKGFCFVCVDAFNNFSDMLGLFSDFLG